MRVGFRIPRVPAGMLSLMALFMGRDTSTTALLRVLDN